MVNKIKYETGTYVFVHATENSHRKILNSQFRNNINLQLLLNKTNVEIINTIFSELTNNLKWKNLTNVKTSNSNSNRDQRKKLQLKKNRLKNERKIKN